MDLQQYLQALRKFWWVVVVAVLLGAGYGVYATSQSVAKYRASVTFFVVAETADASTSAAVQGDQFAQRRVNSYVALLSTDRLAELVAARPDLEVTPKQVQRMMGASGDLDTVLLTATVTSTSEQLARDVGEAVAVDFVNLVDEIEGGNTGGSAVHLEVVSGPSVQELAPRTLLGVGVPAFWGLLLGLGVALLLELRDQTIRSEEQLVSLTSVPVLGRTTEDRRVMTTPLIVSADGMSPFAESVRQLRTNLQFLDVENPVQVVVMTSSVTEEGKSITSANLALSLTKAGYRTLVIDADLRRPTLAGHFHVERSVGLTDVLVGRVDINRALQPWDADLTVLASGSLPPNPSELLGGTAMAKVVAELRTRFDVIVIDTPPVLPVADALVVSAHADGVLLAVRAGHTSRYQVSRSAKSLHAIGAPFLGTVLTMNSTGRSSGYETYEQHPGRGLAQGGTEQRPQARSSAPVDGPSETGGRPDVTKSRPAAPAPAAESTDRSPTPSPNAGRPTPERPASTPPRGAQPASDDVQSADGPEE